MAVQHRVITKQAYSFSHFSAGRCQTSWADKRKQWQTNMVYWCEFVSFIIYKSQVLMTYTSKRGINMSIRPLSLLTAEALQNLCNWIYTNKQGAISQSCGRVSTTSREARKAIEALRRSSNLFAWRSKKGYRSCLPNDRMDACMMDGRNQTVWRNNTS